MLKKYLKSISAKILLSFIIVYAVLFVCGLVVDQHFTLLITPVYILYGIWLLMSDNKRMLFVLSFFNKRLYPVELISFDNSRHFTLAKYNHNNQLVAPVYFSSNVGQVILLDDGTVDKHSESSYIKHWLPLNKNDRVRHILTNDIPI